MAEPLWGAETAKAIDNFRISGEPIPVGVVRWLGRIKAAAALTNAELGLLDDDLATEIAAAGEDIAAGTHDAQFPVDVFQTGSGTSSNMNANEVIAALTAGRAHPNDHVNLGQSSNDVFPTAVHLAALDATCERLLPAVDLLATSLRHRAEEWSDIVKPGRTHLMDAVPVTLGQEFGGYAAQVGAARDRIAATLDEVGAVPLGGTAVGTGLNTHPDFAATTLRRLRAAASERVAAHISEAPDHFAAQGSRDGLVALSGALSALAVALTKICNDVRWMASGPRAGLGEITLPSLQKGSSIMPGKTNPVIPEAVLQVAAQVIGNHTAVTVGAMQGNFELNVMIPLLARNVLQSVEFLSAAVRSLAVDCVDGIEPDAARCRTLAELSLAIATALNPEIGYDAATAIVLDAQRTGRSVREIALDHGVATDVVDRALDVDRMTG